MISNLVQEFEGKSEISDELIYLWGQKKKSFMGWLDFHRVLVLGVLAKYLLPNGFLSPYLLSSHLISSLSKSIEVSLIKNWFGFKAFNTHKNIFISIIETWIVNSKTVNIFSTLMISYPICKIRFEFILLWKYVGFLYRRQNLN